MSTHSNRLQPAAQNLLQCVVQFFHPRSPCPMHIAADVLGGQKSLVKPVMRQNISSCSVLSPEIVMHDDAYIGGRSENNIKCVVRDDLGWKNWTTRYILPHHWLYEWFSQFHRCGTYSVLSRSPSIAADFFHTSVSCFKTTLLNSGNNWKAPWKNQISSTSMKLRKSLVKPLTRQNTSSCSVLSPEIVMHDVFNVILWTYADICVIVHDDLGWKNRTTRCSRFWRAGCSRLEYVDIRLVY